DYAPISVLTAKDNRGVQATVDLASSLFKQAQTRVGTAELNAALESARQLHSASPKRGSKAVKFYYGTQVGVAPPTIVVFVNKPSLVREDYRRFLLNRMRESLPYGEVPIRLVFRSHRRDTVSTKTRTVRS
ncbi:MAG: ribosome biogenesis GTPase Der, partial [Planctomycetes bacterium]|nr:ribosome biogenesis GTPase Der [Planctomycetota bacterium]